MGFRKLIVPTVHLNGSGKKNLTDDLEGAVNALDNAMGALRAMSPHGRDYYVQSDQALKRAQTEHVNRAERLDDIKRELVAIWEGINDNKTEVEVETWNDL
jgi:hypothetical protein